LNTLRVAPPAGIIAMSWLWFYINLRLFFGKGFNLILLAILSTLTVTWVSPTSLLLSLLAFFTGSSLLAAHFLFCCRPFKWNSSNGVLYRNYNSNVKNLAWAYQILIFWQLYKIFLNLKSSGQKVKISMMKIVS
jgi:hypothetical protein